MPTRASYGPCRRRRRADELIRKAFPDPPLHNDFEIPHANAQEHNDLWVDSLRASHLHLHTLLRFAYQQGEESTVEHLALEREETTVLLSYARAVQAGLYPEHVEETRRQEAAIPEL